MQNEPESSVDTLSGQPPFAGRLRAALTALVIIHFVLALAFAFQTPYRASGYYATAHSSIPDIGAPDEKAHANYIQFLVDGKGFPVLDPKDPNLGDNYEAHQPPLYYLYEAGILEVGKAFGVQNVGSTAAGRLLRGGTAVIGALNVLGIFFLALWGLGRTDVGLAAAAFAALLPMNLALSGAISNDPMLYCFCTWGLAFTARGCRFGWTAKKALAVGVFVGLACLTRTTGIALIPAVVLAAYFSGSPRPSPKLAGIAVVAALILVLPWWARNQSLYGDPFAMKAFNAAFVNSPTRTSLGWGWGAYIARDFEFTWRSFIGIFGYMDIPLPDVAARVTAAVLLVFALGAILALSRPEWKYAKATTVLNGSFIAIVVVLFIGFNVKYFQGQARYLFPAIGPICVGFGLGMIHWSKARWATSLGALVTVLVVFNLWIVTQFLPSEFGNRLLTH